MNTLDEQDVEDWLFAKHEAETDVPGGADEVSNSMLSLPVVAIADLTSPAELFRCIFYTTTLSAGSCIARQGVRKKLRGGTHGKYYEKEIVPKIYEYCASGKCMQGSDVRVALADYTPPASAHEKQKERNRALGAENAKSIEKRIAAKVASGEFRPPAQTEVIQPRAPEVPAPEPDDEEEEDVEETRTCSTDGCDIPLTGRNRSGLCKPHQKAAYMLKYHQDRKKNGAPPPTAPPRRKILGRRARAAQRAAIQPAQAKVYPGLLQAQPDGLEQLLSERRVHHLAEAERCERALKALRG